jgi:predicted transcriptional regulator
VAIEPGTYRVRLAGTLEEASEKAAEQEILAYLALRPGEALDEPTILEHVEARTGTKRNALRRLLEDGKVQREGEGRRGSPYRYSRFPVPPIRGERENELPL